MALPEAAPARRGRRIGRYLPILCLLAPLLAFMAVFYGAPLLLLAEQSVRNAPGDEARHPEPTAHHYVRTVESARTFRALTRTFRLSAIATAVALAVCFPIALLLIRAGPRLRTGLLLVIFVSLAASLLVRNYGWLVVLADQGPLNRLLVALGVFARPERLVYSEGAIVVALVHYMMPFVILPIYGALLRIPASLGEASQSLGGSSWTTFGRVVWPLALPGVFGGTILAFAIGTSAFVTPLMLGSPATAMISQVAAEQFLVQQNFPWGSAIVIVLTAATLVIVALYGLVLRKVFRVPV